MQSNLMQRNTPFTSQRPGLCHSGGSNPLPREKLHSCVACASGVQCQTHSHCGCRAGFTCQSHSRKTSTCGICANGLPCRAHGLKKLSCGCSPGFKCQIHAQKQNCVRCASGLKCRSHGVARSDSKSEMNRRSLLQGSLGGLAAVSFVFRGKDAALAAGQPQEPNKILCNSDCQTKLGEIQEVKTASGLRYKDLVVGKGPTPPTGYQVVADYVAMTPDGKVFDSSLDRGRPYDLRVGSGQIVQGLDEGVSSMRAGGLRRIYIPGNLSFPKGLPSGPGRPRVPPASPVMFDVKLLFIPGLDEEE